MRLTENNITTVKELTRYGMTYGWVVSMRSGKCREEREFINYREGKTVIEKYEIERLPKAVQNFLLKHFPVQIEEAYKGQYEQGFTHYIYK